MKQCTELLKFIILLHMNRQEFHAARRKKLAELLKTKVDTAFEYYCSLTEEEKLISELEFARQLAKHMNLKISTARKYTGCIVLEYHVEFIKNKKSRASYGFAGKHHNAKTRAAISKATIESNHARAIKCKELGVNYRTYKQTASNNICADNAILKFCISKRINNITTNNIVI